jgi:HK97 family phage major capsid protein
MPDGDVTLREVKEAIESQNRDFEEFKKVNDRRLDDIEKKGSSDALDEAQLKRINDGLDVLEDIKTAYEKGESALDDAKTEILEKQDDLKAEYKGRLDKIETALKRTPRGNDDTSPEYEEGRAIFLEWARKGHVAEMDQDLFKRGLELKVLSIGDQQQAGYLAQPEWVQELLKGVIEFSPMRSIARVRQTMRNSIHVPKRTGVFAAVWVAEQGTRAETTGLQYGLEEIPTHEMYAFVDVTEQMLEDSVFDLENELNMEFTEQFAVLEGNAFITGNAAGKPEGVLDNTAVGTTNSGSAATIADTDGQANGLIDLQHAIRTEYARNATWILNRATMGAVRKLKDGDNNYIWAAGGGGSGGGGGAVTGNPSTILGDPFVEMPDMPDEAASATPIAYGDFRRAYTIVDRINMSVLRDPFTQATSGAIRFIARRRVGGQVVIAEAIRTLTCST